MDRRELLTAVGAAVGTASLGGCLSEYRDVAGDVGETTDEPTDTTTEGDSGGTTEPSETTDSSGGESSLADASLEIVDSDCGQPTNEASVSFREADAEVGVTGTIAGSNACYIAELAGASYDEASGALTLTVASTKEGGSEVCAECITEIDYEITAAFEGGLPATVEVVHEAMGETTTVTTAEPA
ncbi:hypothetical protein [Halorussus litoreus]|uniref:hypothetical protein n=1 Tax=Halorussus litoreus TaxID=1710536 RepID=UPI000E2852D5|nr:hypothetical protein [Halorussus litoreus]